MDDEIQDEEIIVSVKSENVDETYIVLDGVRMTIDEYKARD